MNGNLTDEQVVKFVYPDAILVREPYTSLFAIQTEYSRYGFFVTNTFSYTEAAAWADARKYIEANSKPGRVESEVL